MANDEIEKLELMKRRALFVQNFINNNSRKGIPVRRSVKLLSNAILFISQRTVYKDLAIDLKIV